MGDLIFRLVSTWMGKGQIVMCFVMGCMHKVPTAVVSDTLLIAYYGGYPPVFGSVLYSDNAIIVSGASVLYACACLAA